MSNDGSLINLGELSKPATVLIEKISDAVGGICKPWQVRRVAEAEADADKIREVARIEITELQRRALHRMVAEEGKKQGNMENITRLALPGISPEAKPENVEDDWITHFFEKCRLISDGEMQVLWSKVLAGEANSPGKYSKRTVELLSSLDKSDADAFQKLLSFAWYQTRVFPLVYDLFDETYSKARITFAGLMHLNDIGLIRFESLAGFNLADFPRKLALFYYGTVVEIELPESMKTLQIGHVLLSNAGQQLAPICNPVPQEGFLDYVVNRWTQQGIKVRIVRSELGTSVVPAKPEPPGSNSSCVVEPVAEL